MPDSASLLAAIQQQAVANRNQQIDMADIYAQQMNIGLQMQDLVTTDAKGRTPEMVRLEATQQMAAQNRVAEFQKRIGISDDFTTDIQMQLADQIQANARAAMAQGQRIGQMESVGLTDNPIQYLLNQWMLPDEYTKYDGYRNQAALAENQLQKINAATQHTAVTAATTKQTMNEAVMADQLRAVENSIKMQKLALEKDNLQTQAHYIKDLYSLEGKRLDLAKAAWEVNRSDEQMTFQREQALAMREARKAALDERRQKAEDKAAAEDAIIQAINAGRIKRHGANTQLVGREVFQKGLFGSKTKQGMELDEYYNIGMDILGGVQPTFGSPLATAAMIQRGDQVLSANAEGNKWIAGLVTAAVSEAQKQAKKPEEINEIASQLIDKKLKQRMGSVDAKDQTNPFGLQGRAVLDNSAALQKDAGWKLYRSIYKDDGAVDGNDYLNKLAAAVASKKISLEDAVKSVTTVAHLSARQNEIDTDLKYLTGRGQSSLVIKTSNEDITGNKFRVGMTGGASVIGGSVIGGPVGLGLGALGLAGMTYASVGNDRRVDLMNSEQVRKAILSKIGRNE